MQNKFLFLGCAILSGIFSVSSQANGAEKVFHFRAPHSLSCRLEGNGLAATDVSKAKWIKVFVGNSTNTIELGDRIAIQLKPGSNLKKLLNGRAAKLSRRVAPDVFILQAPDAMTAMQEAEILSALPEVSASYPVMRREVELQGKYAAYPNDKFFINQWNLENRRSSGAAVGTPAGADLNVRAAWPFSQGEGVTIAVADIGVELDHVELSGRAIGAPHFNFTGQSTNVRPAGTSASWAHATQVAGLAVAELNNGHGMAGVAPLANLASWVIFTTNQLLASDEQLMDMYQYASNTVAVQNHSWGHSASTLNGPSLLEQIGISNAVTSGRFGRGVIMVRSAGNGRQQGQNSNDDGYPSDPRVIAVAANFHDGRPTSYSEPGACILVSAPSGDSGVNLFTTDLIGTNGANQIEFCPAENPNCPEKDTSDYAFNSNGFAGTSAAAPEVSGIAALILSVNTNLTYRDVQQILVFSARFPFFADPDMTTNGAGFRVSHNQGFGVPDAGHAVQLAKNWPLRPVKTNANFVQSYSTAIPDHALHVLISGENVPADLASIATASSQGPHADSPTAILPLVDVGLVTSTISLNLTNKAALIQHGTNANYAFEISRVAQAGAAFAILSHYSDSDVPSVMLGTDQVPIPAVLIGQTKGAALRNYLQTNSTGKAQIRLNSANYSFNIPDTLICEHVGVRVSLNHSSRADLRITLSSPQGTRSVLQHVNGDTSPAPTDWTYWSTHHFYESSAGMWTVSVSDEFPGGTGSVESVELIVQGVAITDSDHDGLDDHWETNHFGSLAFAATDDPDKDGYNNAREQIMGSNPNASPALEIDFSRWNSTLARLSWPGSADFDYQVFAGTNVAALAVVATVPGQFPETEWFTPFPTPGAKFFQVRAVPK